jgi:hypothetical protein
VKKVEINRRKDKGMHKNKRKKKRKKSRIWRKRIGREREKKET